MKSRRKRRGKRQKTYDGTLSNSTLPVWSFLVLLVSAWVFTYFLPQCRNINKTNWKVSVDHRGEGEVINKGAIKYSPSLNACKKYKMYT